MENECYTFIIAPYNQGFHFLKNSKTGENISSGINLKEEVSADFCASNVLDIGEHRIEIYPNPANEIVNISCKEFKICKICISDLTGKEVFYEDVNSFSRNINVSKFFSGMYFLKIETEKGAYFEKIMIVAKHD